MTIKVRIIFSLVIAFDIRFSFIPEREAVLSLITCKNFRATVRVTNAGGYKFSSPILLGKFGLKSIREAGSRSIIHKSSYFCSSLIIQGFYDVVKINPSKRYFPRCCWLSSFINFSNLFSIINRYPHLSPSRITAQIRISSTFRDKRMLKKLCFKFFNILIGLCNR